jgi:hypothetical protein
MPLVVLAGWSTLWAAFCRCFGWSHHGNTLAAGCVLLMGTFWACREMTVLCAQRAGAEYPWRESGQGWMEAGRWLRANAPGSVTMTRNPWELNYYSQERAIQIPLGQLDQVFAVARHYRATHLIPDARRPALGPWLNGQVAGLRKVFSSQDVDLYEIDPEALANP